MAEEGEGRLTRWSRRKRQEQQTRRRGGAAPTAVASVDPGMTPLPGEAESGLPAAIPGDDTGTPEVVDEEAVRDLPPVDSLDKDSDYTPFLNAGVPGKLARAALRKLWSSDPAFNIRDGLDDYDEDFTIIEAMKGALEDKLAEGKDKAAKEDKTEETKETEEDVNGVKEDMDEAGDGEDDGDELAAAETEDVGAEADEPGPETPPGKSKNKRA